MSLSIKRRKTIYYGFTNCFQGVQIYGIRCGGQNQNNFFFKEATRVGGGINFFLGEPQGLAQGMNIIIEKESERAKWEVSEKIN